MKVIVGLGNPGKKYQNTRHNAGFIVVDRIAKQWKIAWKADKKTTTLRALNPPAGGENTEILLVKPQTFMNSSGIAVKKILLCNNITIQQYSNNLFVIHDDLDLPLGKLRISQGRGSAGHKGVESIIQSIGSDEFVRFRVGIGEIRNLKFEIRNWESYVLEEFKGREGKLFKKMITACAQAVFFALKEGIEAAMNKYNYGWDINPACYPGAPI